MANYRLAIGISEQNDMSKFGFKAKTPETGNISKVAESLNSYLARNTGETGFFVKYRLAIALGGVAAAGAVIATVWLRRDPHAKQALDNIAHQAYVDGDEKVDVSVEVRSADEDEEVI